MYNFIYFYIKLYYILNTYFLYTCLSISSFICVLYFLNPFTFATYTFIIDTISFVNSSIGVSFSFLFIITILPFEYFFINHSIISYPKRVNLSL